MAFNHPGMMHIISLHLKGFTYSSLTFKLILSITAVER